MRLSMLMSWIIPIAVFLVLLAIAGRWIGFRAQNPDFYSEQGPEFVLTEHLNGPILCEGVIYGPLGRVGSTFVAHMQGDWNGDTGTLAEDFTYSTGNTQLRKWHLKLGENGQFTATADDIIGTAEGVQRGNTVRMTYSIRLTEEAGGHILDVTDWMYHTGDGVIINRSQMRKFGIKVAELVATMRPATKNTSQTDNLAAE
ncbi:uncharacterized protein DUF3833 [Shimia isoporae]|uniref:Uncharacterized protein DUF3833 n=1 Tax=Shimia isoporae TaxID=647720 RepID=A0A4R1NL40_9RHOB|nr:DUF3833 family protein [Shimia isoporae]TCL09056.1 uncharacterized protein DUF3833 [Shimia isoporae]